MSITKGSMIITIKRKLTSTTPKTLCLYNGAASISEGTVGSMVQMETLELEGKMMISLPHGMINMSKWLKWRTGFVTLVVNEGVMPSVKMVTVHSWV